MPATPRWGLRYPAGSDPADAPTAIGNLAADLDGVAFDDQGPVASRPTSTPGSPGKKGRYYFATDEGVLYRDTGTSWVGINAAGAADGPAAIPTLRSLGTGALQAAAGNDPRLSDQRTPLDGSVTGAKVAAALKPSGGAGAATEALRALGTAAGTAAAGSHASQHGPTGADPLADGSLNVSVLKTAPMISALNTALTVTNNADNWLDARLSNQRGGFAVPTDAQPTRAVAPVAGVYQLGIVAGFPANSGGTLRLVGLRFGGGQRVNQDRTGPFSASFGCTVQLSMTYLFSAGQYAEWVIFQDTGASQNVSLAWWMTRIGS